MSRIWPRDPDRLRTHVAMLCETFHSRDWQSIANLDACADSIADEFEQAGARVEFQVFSVYGSDYRNVIARFGPVTNEPVVVGAHYDAFEDTPGADDNASGVAVLIELAHLLGRRPPDRGIELVAYVLEEPPFYRTANMGSAVHAKRAAVAGRRIAGMIALEMVGCFRDEPGSQSFPALIFRLLYPGRANFVAVVSRWDQGDWVKRLKIGMKGATDLPVYSLRAPAFIAGVDYSDHLNYWTYDIPAAMVTDTAFYRNDAYHTRADTPDTLDYERMGQVVVAVYEAIIGL